MFWPLRSQDLVLVFLFVDNTKNRKYHQTYPLKKQRFGHESSSGLSSTLGSFWWRCFKTKLCSPDFLFISSSNMLSLPLPSCLLPTDWMRFYLCCCVPSVSSSCRRPLPPTTSQVRIPSLSVPVTFHATIHR